MLRLNRQQHILNELRTDITRRWFFKECGVGLGAMALHQLLGGNAPAGSTAPATEHEVSEYKKSGHVQTIHRASIRALRCRLRQYPARHKCLLDFPCWIH